MFSFKKKQKLKEQRDRFLAYAFASADLFIEVDTKDTIIYATGAVKALTGVDPEELPGKKWLTVFESKHHTFLNGLRKQAMPGIRQGPFLIELNKNLGGQQTILTSIKLPNSKHFFITLGLGNPLLGKLSKLMEEHEDGPMLTGFAAGDLGKTTPVTTDFNPDSSTVQALETGYEAENSRQDILTTGYQAEDLARDEPLTTGYVADDLDRNALVTGYEAEEPDSTVLLTGLEPEDANGTLLTGYTPDQDDSIIDERSEFHGEAKRVFKYAKRNNISASMTVFNFGFTEAIPDENWAEIIGRISQMMRNESLADCPPVRIREYTYGMLHDTDNKMDKLKNHIEKISKQFDPLGNGVSIEIKTIDAGLHEISNDEATRALMHTIHAIQENKDNIIERSLLQNMKKLVTTNRNKFSEFKGIIDRVDFSIGFQPIVKTKTGEAEFYEVLSRVNTGDIGDWVLFGEDNGLAPNFDLAVLERVMNYVHFKAGTTRTRFAVNISSKSIENPEFREKFYEQLTRRDLKSRLLIEINNPWTIEDPSTLEEFVTSLAGLGYEAILDKILIDKELPELLKKVETAYLKISHKALKRLCEDKEGKDLVEEVINICKDRKIRMVGQFIEDEEQLEFLRELGIECAQGYLFGKAETAPKFIPPVR